MCLAAHSPPACNPHRHTMPNLHIRCGAKYHGFLWCRAWSQFQQLDQIGSGHASVVHLVWDKHSHTYLAVKCYQGAALRPDTTKQVCYSDSVTKTLVLLPVISCNHRSLRKCVPPDVLPISIWQLFGHLQVCHEVQLHAELDHPNILPLYGAFFEDDDIFLVMPYAHQGSVYHLLRQQSLPEAALVTEIVLPFLAGLQHLHSKGYLHRDIKTENVLVDESGRVMIADFGLAIDTHTSSAVHRVGTPVYMVRCSQCMLLSAPFIVHRSSHRNLCCSVSQCLSPSRQSLEKHRGVQSIHYSEILSCAAIVRLSVSGAP